MSDNNQQLSIDNILLSSPTVLQAGLNIGTYSQQIFQEVTNSNKETEDF